MAARCRRAFARSSSGMSATSASEARRDPPSSRHPVTWIAVDGRRPLSSAVVVMPNAVSIVRSSCRACDRPCEAGEAGDRRGPLRPTHPPPPWLTRVSDHHAVSHPSRGCRQAHEPRHPRSRTPTRAVGRGDSRPPRPGSAALHGYGQSARRCCLFHGCRSGTGLGSPSAGRLVLALSGRIEGGSDALATRRRRKGGPARRELPVSVRDPYMSLRSPDAASRGWPSAPRAPGR
jgi:hypothetical protein